MTRLILYDKPTDADDLLTGARRSGFEKRTGGLDFGTGLKPN